MGRIRAYKEVIQRIEEFVGLPNKMTCFKIITSNETDDNYEKQQLLINAVIEVPNYKIITEKIYKRLNNVKKMSVLWF